jgi:hypothetical protein
MMKSFLILIVTFLSLNSFAHSYYDGTPFNRKTAWKLTNEAQLQDVFDTIYYAIKEGQCVVDYNPNHLWNEHLINKKLESLGYEVISDEKGGYLITWCD